MGVGAVERFAIRGAAASAESWICGGGDIVIGAGNWREHGDLSVSERDSVAHFAGAESAGIGCGANSGSELGFGKFHQPIFRAYKSSVGTDPGQAAGIFKDTGVELRSE